MTISFVSAGLNTTATSGSITPPLPTGWAVNDIFTCVIASRDNVNSTMPAGWIAIDAGTNNGTTLRTATYYKIAATGDTSPTITHPGGNRIEATILAYRGVDTSNPLDVIGTTSVNPSSITVTANSITTLTDTAWVIFTGSTNPLATFSGYSGIPTPTQRIAVPTTGNWPSTFVTDFVMSPAGSTGNRTATANPARVNNALMFAFRPATATITSITDPSGANIYIDGVLQTITTSASIAVTTGNHTVTFYKAGYYSYNETVTGLGANEIVKVCTILQQIVSIVDFGIIICTTTNISTCPITPLACPISVNPLDFINMITLLNSTIPISLTVNFSYTLDSTIYLTSVPVTLASGMNIVYAFPINIQYPPNAILSLDSVTLA